MSSCILYTDLTVRHFTIFWKKSHVRIHYFLCLCVAEFGCSRFIATIALFYLFYFCVLVLCLTVTLCLSLSSLCSTWTLKSTTINCVEYNIYICSLPRTEECESQPLSAIPTLQRVWGPGRRLGTSTTPLTKAQRTEAAVVYASFLFVLLVFFVCGIFV